MNIINQLEKRKIEQISIKNSTNPEKNTVDKKSLEDFNNRSTHFRIGDTVKIHYKIIEGKRERIQVYEGYIIAQRGNGLSKMIKVRKTSYGVGVERTFPLFSPMIARIELVRRGKVKRAKLYYLRNRSGKGSNLKEKINYKKGEVVNNQENNQQEISQNQTVENNQ